MLLVSSHGRDATKLRTLLVGNNRITSLPAELGDLQTLCGLNLAGNPLFFPPEDVLEQGVQLCLLHVPAACLSVPGARSSLESLLFCGVSCLGLGLVTAGVYSIKAFLRARTAALIAEPGEKA